MKHCPDEEGIKTDKKGFWDQVDTLLKHCPDEEGIKTHSFLAQMAAEQGALKHCPDEEGIKTWYWHSVLLHFVG